MPNTRDPEPYETSKYKNVPQNEQHIQDKIDEGYEVYERNARFVRLRIHRDDMTDEGGE